MRYIPSNWLLRELIRRDPTFRPAPIVSGATPRAEGKYEFIAAPVPVSVAASRRCYYCGSQFHRVDACPQRIQDELIDAKEAEDSCPECGRKEPCDNPSCSAIAIEEKKGPCGFCGSPLHHSLECEDCI